MQEKLRRYVDDLFLDTLPTKKSVEFKEEMIQNLHDKYNDLVSAGKTEEAAYNIAVAGIGDISGLLDELAADAAAATPYLPETEAIRVRSAMFTAIAVMGYILSPLPLIVLSTFGSANTVSIGLPALFLMIAASTGLIVFSNMSKPRHYNNSETIVDEFREWQSDSKRRRSLRSAISGALWSVIVALYFIISFSFGSWHMTWIIFLLGVALEAFINVFFAFKK